MSSEWDILDKHYIFYAQAYCGDCLAIKEMIDNYNGNEPLTKDQYEAQLIVAEKHFYWFMIFLQYNSIEIPDYIKIMDVLVVEYFNQIKSTYQISFDDDEVGHA